MNYSSIITYCVIGLFLFRYIIAPPTVMSMILYKTYIIQQDNGADVLCDPYVVQKNDYITKLFQQRGKISEEDFPEFLEIFKRLNTHIADVDIIQPGQRIYIPLKKLSENELLDQDAGVVTIPLITISNLYEFIKGYTIEHEVQKDDWVSKLIVRDYGNYGTELYDQGLELFKLLNPEITDLNRISIGQDLLLPDPLLHNQPWYQSLFDSSGRIAAGIEFNEPSAQEDTSAEGVVFQESTKENSNLFQKVAEIFNGKLHERGSYHFPLKGREDFKLNLSDAPIVELKGGNRLLFLKKNMHIADRGVIESFWKNTEIITVPTDGSAEHIFESVFSKMDQDQKKQISFSDNGLKVNVQSRWILKKPSVDNKEIRYTCINLIEHPRDRVPDSVLGYLKEKGIIVEDILQNNSENQNITQVMQENHSAEDIIPINQSNPRIFIKNLLRALGIRYAENVKITFPYVGIQVKAISNLISTHRGENVIVDFEDLYGDAIRAIKETGVTIVQIKKEETPFQIIEKLFAAMKENYTVDPTFNVSKRPSDYNTTFIIPGFLLQKEGYPNKTLLASVPLHDNVAEFLKIQGVNIILIHPDKKTMRIG